MAAPAPIGAFQSSDSMPAAMAASSPLKGAGRMISGQATSAGGGGGAAAAAVASGAMPAAQYTGAALVTKQVTKAALTADAAADIDALPKFTDPKHAQRMMQMIAAKRALHKSTESPNRSPAGSPSQPHRSLGLKSHKPSSLSAAAANSAAGAPSAPKN